MTAGDTDYDHSANRHIVSREVDSALLPWGNRNVTAYVKPDEL